MAKPLSSKVLPGGIVRVVHVYVPTLHERLKNGGDAPVWAVRTSEDDFLSLTLYRKVEILGPSEGIEHFDTPLPGTNGRGVAPLYTSAAIRVFYDKGRRSKKISFAAEESKVLTPAGRT